MSDLWTPPPHIAFAHVDDAGLLVLPKAERLALDAFVGTLPPGTCLMIGIEVETPVRSRQALRYYFGVVIKEMANECGYSRREMHDELVRHLLPIPADRPWDVTSLPEDQELFSEYVEACIVFAATFLELFITPPRRRR